MNNLNKILLKNWDNYDNEVIKVLFRDYRLYHGIVFILFLLMSIGSFYLMIRKLKKFRETERKSFESRRLIFSGGLMMLLFLFFTLLTFANATNTFVSPKQGFQTMTENFETISDDNKFENEKTNFGKWIESGNSNFSPEIRSEVINWRNFHLKKTVTCIVLLIVLFLFRNYFRKYLVNKEKTMHNLSLYNYISFFSFSLPTVLLVLMIIANIQGSISPLFSYLIRLT